MKYIYVLLIGGMVLFSCSGNEQEQKELTGKQLALSACSSCHAYPGPELLPQEQWKNVLPHMGLRLGIESAEHDPFPGFNMEETQRILSANVFPDEQVLDDSLWQKLEAYFLENAPDSLDTPLQEHPIQPGIFKPVLPELSIGGAPFISMVKFDELGSLNLADRSGNLLLINEDLQIEKHTFFPKPVIDVSVIDKEQAFVLSIGELYPNDKRTGAVGSFDRMSFSTPSLVLDNLPRPVQFARGDIDADGLEDLLICNFGNYVGDLSYYRNTGSGYEQRRIKSAPGATRAFLYDVDGDSDLDVIALFAQGDEGISIFYNEVVKFRERRILRFNPLYGSNDMVLQDMDGDGDLDIILSNGDNGDHSITLKPYHGIRIFLNDGEWNFTESNFHPLYGSSKVRVADFDMDGDMDIIAASYFPDSRNGLGQSIVLLINKGNLQFDPYSVEGADQGRWMVMDTGDFDKDGDVDVVLGSFTLAHEEIPAEILSGWQRSGKYILALENQSIP